MGALPYLVADVELEFVSEGVKEAGVGSDIDGLRTCGLRDAR